MLKNINKHPRLLNYFVKNRWFSRNKIIVVDVGARSNFESHWKFYKDQIKLIGFEPDRKECARLNKLYSNENKIFYPVALGEKKEVRTFYMTKYPASSGFLEPDLEWMGRFPDKQNLIVKNTTNMETVDFDSYSKEKKLSFVDFMKFDVEGFELQVLKGAQKSLSDVLGISIEVEFQQNHKGQAIFSDIDNFLRERGFFLYDATLYRHSRKILPALSAAKVPGPTSYGQVLWAQALYFKDPIIAINSAKDQRKWSKTKITKLISLMELFNLNDCAMELVEYFGKRGVFGQNELRQYLDLLVPKVHNKKFNYQDYLKKVSVAKNKGYTSQINRIKVLLYKMLSHRFFQTIFLAMIKMRLKRNN